MNFFYFYLPICKAVIPIFELGCFILIPVLANKSKTSACPHLAARWIGVKPDLFSSFGETPLSNLKINWRFFHSLNAFYLHYFYSFQVTSLCCQVQWSIFIKSIFCLSHRAWINIKHCLKFGNVINWLMDSLKVLWFTDIDSKLNSFI